MNNPNYQITEHFKYRDCSCKCCGELIINNLLYEHMMRLEEMRQALGFRIIIDSGHRCIKHNEEVGGKPLSMHLKFATDIRPLREEYDDDAKVEAKLHTLIVSAPFYGFRGIGKYDTFVHLDMRDVKTVWEG